MSLRICQCLLVMSIFLTSLVSGETAKPVLNQEKVQAIARAVLKTPKYRGFTDSFELEKLRWDAEKRIWSFLGPKTFPVTFGSSVQFFFVRDADGHFRVGELSSSGKTTPKAAEKFRMPVEVRKRMGRELRVEIELLTRKRRAQDRVALNE